MRKKTDSKKFSAEKNEKKTRKKKTQLSIKE